MRVLKVLQNFGRGTDSSPFFMHVGGDAPLNVGRELVSTRQDVEVSCADEEAVVSPTLLDERDNVLGVGWQGGVDCFDRDGFICSSGWSG